MKCMGKSIYSLDKDDIYTTMMELINYTWFKRI